MPGYFLNLLSLIGDDSCIHFSDCVSLFWPPEHQICLKKNQESITLQNYRFSSMGNDGHHLHETGYKWHLKLIND